MKVLMVKGSPRREGNTAISLAEMEKVFRYFSKYAALGQNAPPFELANKRSGGGASLFTSVCRAFANTGL